jgi:hypothetical protein
MYYDCIYFPSIYIYIYQGKLEGRIEVTGKRGRRHKQLLDYLTEKIGCWKLKEEASDRTV